MIYELNLEVRADIVEDFRACLDFLILKVLSAPGFLRATWFELEGETSAEQTNFVVHYHVDSCRDLNAFLKECAEKERADGLEKFGDRYKARRRILKPLKLYGG
ncbi:MAG: DUF4286 family protein [Myxococcota bacterium]|nr:DUF4286 family protein [Myxococcota bacterium]